jgi:tRNA nucleotidyltransferase (CCA-adding enzyme)
MMVLEQAARLSSDTHVRFAALVHDLGKGLTPKEEWPKHKEHEEKGVELVENLCKRYRVPNDYRDLAIHVARYHLHYHRAMEVKANTILKLLQNIDAFRKPKRFEQFLLACEADARGRTGFEDRPCPQSRLLRQAFNAAAGVNPRPLIDKGLQGKALGQELYRKKILAIKSAIHAFQEDS